MPRQHAVTHPCTVTEASLGHLAPLLAVPATAEVVQAFDRGAVAEGVGGGVQHPIKGRGGDVPPPRLHLAPHLPDRIQVWRTPAVRRQVPHNRAHRLDRPDHARGLLSREVVNHHYVPRPQR